MVLAHLFLHTGVPFSVAHCNFKLRGAESDGDELLVMTWCETNNITFHATHFDTKGIAKEWKKGTQETARDLRYVWFKNLCEEYSYSKIATAHHGNDNVETMLINLFKGTGIAGMHGILPDNGIIIRPLLFAQKEEIMTFVAQNNIQYREDASNASNDYLRNAVRHKLIPAINELFPDSVTRVNESITRFAEVEQIYKKGIEKERKRLLEKRGQDFYIPVLKLKNTTPLNTVVYELISAFGFTALQVGQVVDLINAESGRYVTSASHRIIKNRDFLIITTIPAETTDIILVEQFPCVVETDKKRFSFSLVDKPSEIDKNATVAYIDAKLIELPILLRKWKTGDYFYPIGMNMKKKKVSRVLINEKVPLHEKEHIFVLENQKKIMWLAGFRLDERFKIKETTEKVLRVKMTDL